MLTASGPLPLPRPRLQPLGLGELLDRTIRLYRRNFFAFLGILGIVYIPLSLVQMVLALLASSQVVTTARTPDELFSGGYLATQSLAFFNVLLTGIFVSG